MGDLYLFLIESFFPNPYYRSDATDSTDGCENGILSEDKTHETS